MGKGLETLSKYERKRPLVPVFFKNCLSWYELRSELNMLQSATL